MRNIFLAVGLLIGLSSCSWAATPSVAQKANKACSAANGTCATASITTTTGNSVAVACSTSSTSTTISISDGTNTYTPVGNANITQTSEGSARWFVAKNITGVAHVITCSGTAAESFISVFVYELSGASTTAPVDVPNTSTAGGSGITSCGASPVCSFTLPTTTFAHDLLLFASACGNSCSADAGADAGNSQTDGSGDESETYTKSATGTYTGNFTQTAGAAIVTGVAITDGVSGGGASGTAPAVVY